MTKVIASVLFCLAFIGSSAQDEGAVVKKERIQRDKSIFFGGGVSIPGGSNLGDYSAGINFDGGFNKRLNRIVSVGVSISYLKFKYDPEVTTSNSGGLGNVYYDTSAPTLDHGYYLTLSGGDVSIISLAGNLKINFVPVKDNSVISVYAFARPFIASTSVSAVSAFAAYYFDDGTDFVADPTGALSPYAPFDPAIGNGDVTFSYEAKSSITGGIYVGPGIEFNPAKPISIFLQASFGYTFPLEVVSTKSYSNDVTVLLGQNSFPLQSLGFTSINFSAGISINLD